LNGGTVIPPTPALTSISETSAEYSWDFQNVARYGADFDGTGFDLTYNVIAPTYAQWGYQTVNWVFTDLDWIGFPGEIITGVTVISNDFMSCPQAPLSQCSIENMNSVAIDLVEFGDDFIHMSIGLIQLHTYDAYPLFNPIGMEDAVFNARIEITTEGGKVPVPATLALLGLGLAAISFTRKHKA